MSIVNKISHEFERDLRVSIKKLLDNTISLNISEMEKKSIFLETTIKYLVQQIALIVEEARPMKSDKDIKKATRLIANIFSEDLTSIMESKK